MKFDVIIGNPPYQLSDGGGGGGDSSSPLYNVFIDKAKDLNPNYITMIIPSRWMKGGKGLKSFRINMMNDKRIKYIYDYQNSETLFPSVNIDGGVCYFLWDKSHNGKAEYTYIVKGKKQVSRRYLKTPSLDTVIRNYKHLSIIKKSKKLNEESFDKIVSVRDPFGFKTNLFSTYKDNNIDLIYNNKKGYHEIYGTLNGERKSMFINKRHVVKNSGEVDKYKLLYPVAFGAETTLLPNVKVSNPSTLCTGTFLAIGSFTSEEQAKNCLNYMKTKFFRILFQANKYSFVSSKRTFSLIPLQDFSKSWTDEELYKKYKLTQEEIDYIEENIDPMD